MSARVILRLGPWRVVVVALTPRAEEIHEASGFRPRMRSSSPNSMRSEFASQSSSLEYRLGHYSGDSVDSGEDAPRHDSYCEAWESSTIRSWNVPAEASSSGGDRRS